MPNNETIQSMLVKFLPFAQERMGFENTPEIRLENDEVNAQQPLGKTAYYDPSSSIVTVFVSGRHPKDIMRSISHELVHHTQNGRGEFEKVATVGEGYAQNDDHLREMEREAYEQGNLCFRDWEDSVKTQNENIMEFFGHDDNIPQKEEAEIVKQIRKETLSLDIPINEPETVGFGLQFLNKLRNSEEIKTRCKAPECSTGLKVAQRIFDEETKGEELNMFEKRNKKLNERMMKKFGYVNEIHTAADLARGDAGEYSPGDEAHRQDEMHKENEALERVMAKVSKKVPVSEEMFQAANTLYWEDEWPTGALGQELYNALEETIGAAVGDKRKTDLDSDPYGFLADKLKEVVQSEVSSSPDGMAYETVKKVKGSNLKKGDKVEDPDGGSEGDVLEPTLVRGKEGATAEFSDEGEPEAEVEPEEEEELKEESSSDFDKEYGEEFSHLFVENEEDEECEEDEGPTKFGKEQEEEDEGQEMSEGDLYFERNKRLNERLIKWSSK